MKDRELDAILSQAAQVPHDVDPALLASIGNSVGRSLTPVRPLPPAWALTGGLILISGAVALAGAGRLGLYGIQKMSVLDRALIFPALGLLLWLGDGSLALVTVFAILFRDYHTHHFVHEGIACLSAGLLHAIPAALASWVLLRRGFAVNPVAAGLVAGTIAGLAGVTMLELHCPNFEAPHVILWHTAVVPVSWAAGALLGWLRNRRA